MRRLILAAAAVVVALVVQLTVINGLRLPGGGVPDLVLLVVVALGLASGPATGAVIGFAAGLCVDLAPPGSGIVGEYALAFCLVGWACGRFRGTLARSALLPIIIAATAAIVGELMVAALGMALQPDQVSWTSVRHVLPGTLLFDIVVSPFVLYLILLAGAWLTDAATGPAIGPSRARALAGASASAGGSMPGRTGLGGTAGLGGAAGGAVLLGLGGWLAGPPQSRRGRRAAARQAHRLRPGSRPGDGWVGGGSHGALGGLGSPSFRIRGAGGRAMRGQAFSGRTVSSITRGDGRGGLPGGGGATRGGSSRGALSRGGHGSAVARLRSGVAGSAASGQVPRTFAASPVRLRLGGGRRLGGRGSVVVGRAMSRASLAKVGRRRNRASGGFRPAVMPGGSATGSPGTRHPTRVSLSPAAPVRFGGRRRDGLVGGGVLTRASRAGTRAASPKLRFQAGLPAPRLTNPSGRPATPRFRRRPLSVGRSQTGRRPRFRHHPWSVMALLTRRRGGLLTPRRVRRGVGGAAPDFRRAGAWRASSKRTGGPE